MPKPMLLNGQTVGTAVLSCCAVLLTAVVLRREFAPQPATATDVRDVPDWQRVGQHGNLIGNPEAPMRVVEFSDFQCPYCAQVRGDLAELIERNPGRVALVYRHFPLEGAHPHARKAALAAECAAAQDRFTPFHDALFLKQDSIGKLPWARFATDAGVSDLDEFARCVSEERFRDRVERDVTEGRRIGVRGTPSFVFDGKLMSGSNALEALNKWVAKGNR